MKFEPMKATLTINKKSHDTNGNSILNVDIVVNRLNENESFKELTAQNKTLSNGTLNIKDYQFRVEESIKEILLQKFGVKEVEVIENYHR